MTDSKTALVIGITGGIGGAVAHALLDRGWQVRAINRNIKRAAEAHPEFRDVDWRQGDAMKKADVIDAAAGVSVIVHAANPAGYRNWETLVLPMLDSTMAAAEASGARIVLPGNVYNFGPDAFPLLGEDMPQKPETRKGRIRVEMERRLEAAAATGIKSLIVRAGDFFGPKAGNNWFGGAMVRPGKPVGSVMNPGKPGVGHAWAYLPDVAETMVRLIEREDQLATFERFHFGGHWIDNDEMPKAIARVVGRPDLTVRSFPWWAVGLGRPLVPLAREIWEMRYLWNRPVQLDNRKLVAFLGEEPHTPLDRAVEESLKGLGCLETAANPKLALAA